MYCSIWQAIWGHKIFLSSCWEVSWEITNRMLILGGKVKIRMQIRSQIFEAGWKYGKVIYTEYLTPI